MTRQNGPTDTGSDTTHPLVERLRSATDGAERPAAEAALIEAVKATGDHAERNELAIAMADHAVAGGVAVIGGLLRDPRTATQRGTLIYALSEFPEEALDADTLDAVRAVQQNEAESWEARQEAGMLLDRLFGEHPGATPGLD